MNLQFIDEPELEFGTGRHVDVRFGINSHFPFDASDDATRTIRLGVIGTSSTIEGVLTWLEKCAQGIPGVVSNKPTLHPDFPGFRPDTPFRCGFVSESKMQMALLSQEVDDLVGTADAAAVVEKSVVMFAEKIDRLVELGSVDVILIAPPAQLLDAMVPDELSDEQDAAPADRNEDGEDGTSSDPVDFRDLLKARAMSSGKAIQVVLPTTYGGKKTKHQANARKPRKIQDEATRAWNFFTGLYYKAGGIPWRLMRDPGALKTCFVGISYFRTLDEKSVWTSVAQVFDERGDGVIVRGSKTVLSKEDRRPCLTLDGAHDVMKDAITRFREIHRHSPARVVVHKTSRYTDDEQQGFVAALKAERIDVVDLLAVSTFGPRLYRNGAYPVLRGTFLSLDDHEHLIYTRGGVDFYETYTGLYVPRPLFFRCKQAESTPRELAREMLALSKMNWNSSQFDHRDPITIKAAREVGAVLKHLREGEKVFPRYSFYM